MVTCHLEVESSIMIFHNFWNRVQFFPCVELVSKLYATYTFSWLQSLLKMTRSSQAVTKNICAVLFTKRSLSCDIGSAIPSGGGQRSFLGCPHRHYQPGEIVSWQTFACTVRSSGKSMSIALQTCGPLLVVKLNP